MSSGRRGIHLVTPLVLAALTAGLVQVGRDAWGISTAMGASRRRIAPLAMGSTRFDGEVFTNRLPGSTLEPGSGWKILRGLLTHGKDGKPKGAVPLGTSTSPAQAAGLAVTWLGHASVLLEIDGLRVLADPVWSERVSPSRLVGPRRMHPVPAPLSELPPVDVVVISHDHYDHLDLPTIRSLVETQTAPFVVPLGIGAHLRQWDVPENRIVELDWDQDTRIGGLTLTCTEARHFSGRAFTRNTTLWSSWTLSGPVHRVFFGGDTGYTPAFAQIGARYGPFDLTLLPIGAYNESWPDIHMNPEEAWRAHGDLGGRRMLPIHWATFDLAFHSWAEPVSRLVAAAGGKDVLLIPRPGERLIVDEPVATVDWWGALR